MRLLRQFLFVWLALLLALPVAAQESTEQPTLEPPPEGPASTVNGEAISAADFQARVRLARFLPAYMIRETTEELVRQGIDLNQAFGAVQGFYGQEINSLLVGDVLGAAVLRQMEEDALLTQLTTGEVTAEAVDEAIEAFIFQATDVARPPAAAPESTAEPTAEATPDPALDSVNTFLAEAETRAGISASVVRTYFRAQVIRDQVLMRELGPMPEEAPFLTVRHILVATEEEAQDVLARLADGEAFADVAQEVSIDPGSGARGGELGVTIAEQFVDPFAEAVRDAPLNEVVGPVQSEFGYHLIEVTAREDRPLTPETRLALERYRQRRFDAWLDEQLSAAQVDRVSNWPDFIPTQPRGEELLGDMLENVGS